MMKLFPCRLGSRLSNPVIWNPPPVPRMTLFSKVTCSTTHQAHVPPWFLVVNRMAVPDCACDQLFENRLGLVATRRAFFNSNSFFPCHNVAAPGDPVVKAT